MNVIKKLTFRSLKKNRKRTAVTIIGIILATALLTAVANMAESMRESVIVHEKQTGGDFHYLFRGVAKDNLKYFENNKFIEKLGYGVVLGYAPLEGCINEDKPYLYVCAYDEAGVKMTALKLTEGRMPENERELVISDHIRYNGGVKLQIGDTLRLNIGRRETKDGYALEQQNAYSDEETFIPVEEKEYTVVGIMERPNYAVERWTAPGYTAVTGMGNFKAYGKTDVYASYTKSGLKKHIQVTAGLMGISEAVCETYFNGEAGLLSSQEREELGGIADFVQRNDSLIRWELLRFSGSIMNMLYSMAAVAIAIIIVTAVFCIRNSFVISLTEKLRLYGMISSVGATGRQRKKMVYYEAMILAAIGIPLGILSGVAATAIVIQFTGKLMENSLGVELVFVVSVPAMIAGALLSCITVFLSALRTAGRAAGLSPITAIRSNDTVKRGKRELKAPGVISRSFGVGGVIAYRNLKRAKVKYRTTVVSIVVSVAVFISMTTFINLGFKASTVYYRNLGYQIYLSLQNESAYEQAKQIIQTEGVQESNLVRTAGLLVAKDSIPYTEDYKRYGDWADSGEEINVCLFTIGEDAYREYCRSLGISYEEAADKAIVCADYRYCIEEENGPKYYTGNAAEFKMGDVIKGHVYEEELELEVAAQTEQMPMFGDNVGNAIKLIVSDTWFEENFGDSFNGFVFVYLACDDANSVEEKIRTDSDFTFNSFSNYGKSYEQEKSLFLLISVFLYGFITVISLIGVTNIFNTITTNMELRNREFAMLRAIGMTGREFRRMIWLESLFYGVKSLCIGIPIGCALSYCFHRAFTEGVVTGFALPLKGIAISVIAVLLLVFGIMRYSMGKIKRKDMISAMQNENI